MAIYRTSCASTFTVINTDSVATVWGSASSFFIVYRFFLTYLHERTFMYPLRFSFRNISGVTTSDLLVASTGEKVSMTCSCVSYFLTSA